MIERRTSVRTEVMEEAGLFFSASRSIFHGAALNISASGAKLALDRLYALPPRFLLSFDGFNSAQSCSVVWSRGNFLGVRFEPATLPAPAMREPARAQ
ncbi:MAG TPA: PilZ domain-containing protein [Pseudorhodoplanes sp.]|jgi:hypothetical protein|nr:PilZ domain-containing protein [Pseudorhodoplanes sp.]